MLQVNNTTTLTPKVLNSMMEETYTYEDREVKIITVFTENGKSTALVEDENGELFEVSRDSLR